MAGPNYGMPSPHHYTEADLRPTVPDPRCDPSFPLANYWPVYLGNFWCDVYPLHAERIQEYFGSKGLLVRMVFGRDLDCDPYVNEQRRCQCYDFLVYFVSQQDAQDAIYYCNRDMYYGHRLNVLSGRTPTPFDTSTSAKHTLLRPEQTKMTEQSFENYVQNRCGAQVRCIVRHSKEDFLVQYASSEDRNRAIENCKISVPGLIPISQAKQRFLEQSVEMEIMLWIRVNKSFVDMLPPDYVLQPLLNGYLPNINKNWIGVSKVLPTGKLKFRGRKNHRRYLEQKITGKAMELFGVECSFIPRVSEEVLMKRQLKKERKKAEKLQRKQAKQNTNNAIVKNPLNMWKSEQL